MKQSYSFWIQTDSNSGISNDSYYSIRLPLTSSEWTFDDDYPAMNDNDWPNGVPMPRRASNDLLGAIGAFACGGGWGSVIAGVCASLAN